MADLSDIDIAWLKANVTDERGVLQPLLDELLRHRATIKRLEEWAKELDVANHPVRSTKDVSDELRNRIRGG